MENFLIVVDKQEYLIEKTLQEDIFKVTLNGDEFLAGKTDDGSWTQVLAGAAEAGLPIDRIGKEIEAHLNRSN